MRFPIYFDGSIPLNEIANALAGIGVHLRSDPANRMVADNVPRIIRKDENVVPLRKRRA